jgi:hypothetical protein
MPPQGERTHCSSYSYSYKTQPCQATSAITCYTVEGYRVCLHYKPHKKSHPELTGGSYLPYCRGVSTATCQLSEDSADFFCLSLIVTPLEATSDDVTISRRRLQSSSLSSFT